MTSHLRDLIRSVRACKTQAAERAVIATESAAIRRSFKDPDSAVRHRNVAKLLFIHMLGYPTHFGQIECLKLIGSHKFAEKRIGYLGLMTMLDERHEVLMLVTNSLKQDLNENNPYVIGLALCAMGNISSVDILRDLQGEVEKLLKSSNPYVRKKAFLVLLRMIRKVPSLLSSFVQYVRPALSDRDPSVLIAAVSLTTEMLLIKPKLKSRFSKLVPTLVSLLKSLSTSGYKNDREVSGVNDPFLQVRVMRLLRLLGANDESSSEEMNDALAQVATNTESSKNPGSAILYECVRTIMSIEAESGLRVMAINILGRFLLNRDNNIRYVALSSLCECVSANRQAIQRHRSTIVECLKDADISIRRRALQLTYSLVNKANVRELVSEFVSFLKVHHSDRDFKADLAAKITSVVERFSPDVKWHVDMLIEVLQAAGNVTEESVPYRLAMLVTQHADIRAYALFKMFSILNLDSSMLSLATVGLWSFGEYGDLLLSETALSTANSIGEGAFSIHTESAVIDIVERCLLQNRKQVQQYALSALLKLTARFNSKSERIKALLRIHRADSSVELQARSCEFSNLLADKFDACRKEALAVMPAVDPDKIRTNKPADFFENDRDSEEEDEDSENEDSESDSDVEEKRVKAKERKQSKPKATSPEAAPVVDLLDFLGTGSMAAPASASASTASAQASNTSVDVLANLFGPSEPMAPMPVTNVGTTAVDSLEFLSNAPVPLPHAAPGRDLLDFGASPSPSPMAASSSAQFPPVLVLDSDGLKITISFPESGDSETRKLVANFVNSNLAPVENFEFKVAVPKYIRIRVMPASASILPPNASGVITQVITVTNSLAGQKPLLLKVKVNGTIGGVPFSKHAQVKGFPPGF